MIRAQRIYLYVVLAATAVIMAIGLVTLVGTLIDQLWPGRVAFGVDRSGLSRGIAMTVVAAPVWYLHWRFASRQTSRDPSERSRGLRQAYLAFVKAVAIGFIGFGIGGIVADVSGGRGSVSGDTIARVVIWGAVWTFHWRVARTIWQPGHSGRSWHRWYLYVVSAGTLISGVVGVSRLVGGLLNLLFDAASGESVLYAGEAWTRGMQSSLGAAAAGWGLWYVHWRVGAKGDRGSVLRDVYVTGTAVAAVAVIAIAAILVMQILVRTALGSLGEPVESKLRDVTGWLALGVSAGVAWAYMTSLVLWPKRALEPSYSTASAQWAYKYAAAAVGLAATATAAIVGIAIIGDAVTPADEVLLAGTGSVREAIAIAVASLAVGLVIWLPIWMQVKRASDSPEKGTVERLYMFGVTGAGLLAAVGGAAALLYIVFNDALNGDLSARTVASARWAFGVVVAGGVIAYLHSRAMRGGLREAITDVVPARRGPKSIVVVKRGSEEVEVSSGAMTRLAGVSKTLTASEGIHLAVATIPPGRCATTHYHTNCESAIYVVSGRGLFLAGDNLEIAHEIGPGDYIYVPPDAVHQPVNTSATEPLVIVVARNAPVELVVDTPNLGRKDC